jgi:hypothetical protein
MLLAPAGSPLALDLRPESARRCVEVLNSMSVLVGLMVRR